MVQVTLKEIEGDVKAFLEQLESGENITVLRDNEPVAEVMPLAEKQKGLRPHGLAEGEFTVPESFDGSLPEGL